MSINLVCKQCFIYLPESNRNRTAVIPQSCRSHTEDVYQVRPQSCRSLFAVVRSITAAVPQSYRSHSTGESRRLNQPTKGNSGTTPIV